ncbi:hypothetical protein ABZP36_018988 [Zizania latifolia]
MSRRKASPSPPAPQQQTDRPWSDGETSALIDAWGPLYVGRNRGRGRLSVHEWRAAAKAVNAHRAAAGCHFIRTRRQCQNRINTVKVHYRRELSKPAPSGWRHFSRLQAFLAGPEGPPPGFPAKMPASVKEEEEVVGCRGGLVGSWTVPTRPRSGAAARCPATVVTKLAQVYERVELARLDVEKEKVAMERKKIAPVGGEAGRRAS